MYLSNGVMNSRNSGLKLAFDGGNVISIMSIARGVPTLMLRIPRAFMVFLIRLMAGTRSRAIWISWSVLRELKTSSPTSTNRILVLGW
ncbi:hypothetical protein HanIR_Chr01g0036831 [Helianthus annuus]|nr:hypothetical protein HanIR_Chr01g0036831 [Helianthus annuus]